MTDRPRCESCHHFVRGGETNGTCRALPPTFSVVYRPASPTTEGEDETAPARRTSGPWGRWPVVSADSACCGNHPLFPAYAKALAGPTPVAEVPRPPRHRSPDDDDNPF